MFAGMTAPFGSLKLVSEDQSKESGVAISSRYVFDSPPKDLAALVGAKPAVHRVAGRRTRPDGAPRFRYFAEPFRTMVRCVDGRTFAGNAPASVESLEPIHDASEIFADCQVTARQLLQRSSVYRRGLARCI